MLTQLIKLAQEQLENDSSIVDEVARLARKHMIRQAVREIVYSTNDIPNHYAEYANGRQITHR
jgi:hypothetical protein